MFLSLTLHLDIGAIQLFKTCLPGISLQLKKSLEKKKLFWHELDLNLCMQFGTVL